MIVILLRARTGHDFAPYEKARRYACETNGVALEL